ncbi:unnamed protein product [marine sediment metagenome]|uniref:Carbohydrate kinase FGGY N-terminal domain-containing protein n=1 Tax=marine sediment metagenome TaxID=412755 RepID=X0Z7V1_9ZZZZ
MMRFLLGLDVGTTSTRTIIINENGKLVASSTSDYKLLTPKPVYPLGIAIFIPVGINFLSKGFNLQSIELYKSNPASPGCAYLGDGIDLSSIFIFNFIVFNYYKLPNF